MTFTVIWSRERLRSRIPRAAHLVREPIAESKMACCSTDLHDGRGWTPQEPGDPTPRCGKCGEAERNHLKDHVVLFHV